MIPPKCRICGMREHNHRCQGGTPAQQVAEQQRLRRLGPSPDPPKAAAPAPSRSRDDGTRPGPKPPQKVVTHETKGEPHPRQRWHDDTDSAGEPTEIADYIRKPARFYAPAGQCVYCDRRRAAARVSMRAVRERGEA